MADKRKSFADNLSIPEEEASRILIEKEKAITQSELKYHIKAVCSLLDKIRSKDSAFTDAMARNCVKFLLARHGNIECFDEISEYMDNLSENFLEKEIMDRLKDEF